MDLAFTGINIMLRERVRREGLKIRGINEREREKELFTIRTKREGDRIRTTRLWKQHVNEFLMASDIGVHGERERTSYVASSPYPKKH